MLLQEIPGVLILKFGASWCEPCKIIENDVKTYFSEMPGNVQCVNIDIDESVEIYGFLKTKKMVKGIPALLAYYEGNNNYIPDEFVNGTDKKELKYFFDTCLDPTNLDLIMSFRNDFLRAKNFPSSPFILDACFV